MAMRTPINETSSPRPAYEKPSLKDKAKAFVKELLGVNLTHEEEAPKSAHYAAYEELEDSPAFNSSKILNKSRIGPTGIHDKAIAFVQGTAEAIVHPKAAMKQRVTKSAAGNLAKSNPYLNRKADLDFLEAFDDLEEAKVSKRLEVAGEEERKQREQIISERGDRVEMMKRRRQNLRVAWVTARHGKFRLSPILFMLHIWEELFLCLLWTQVSLDGPFRKIWCELGLRI